MGASSSGGVSVCIGTSWCIQSLCLWRNLNEIDSATNQYRHVHSLRKRSSSAVRVRHRQFPNTKWPYSQGQFAAACLMGCPLLRRRRWWRLWEASATSEMLRKLFCTTSTWEYVARTDQASAEARLDQKSTFWHSQAYIRVAKNSSIKKDILLYSGSTDSWQSFPAFIYVQNGLICKSLHLTFWQERGWQGLLTARAKPVRLAVPVPS